MIRYFGKVKIALVFIMLVMCSFAAHAKVKIGDVPYDELGKTIQGNLVKISDYKGKVVIVSFWATWCNPCMKELPVLGGIQKAAGQDKIQVISVNYKENKKIFKSIAEALVDNPLMITHDKSGFISRKYGVGPIPHMVIIDKNGIVKNIHIGYSEKKLPELIDEINKLIAAEA